MLLEKSSPSTEVLYPFCPLWANLVAPEKRGRGPGTKSQTEPGPRLESKARLTPGMERFHALGGHYFAAPKPGGVA
jgi:hypothetical protein